MGRRLQGSDAENENTSSVYKKKGLALPQFKREGVESGEEAAMSSNMSKEKISGLLTKRKRKTLKRQKNVRGMARGTIAPVERRI